MSFYSTCITSNDRKSNRIKLQQSSMANRLVFRAKRRKLVLQFSNTPEFYNIYELGGNYYRGLMLLPENL